MNAGPNESASEPRWVACHECDRLHRVAPLPPGGKALCVRCGAFLYHRVSDTLNRCLALNVTALLLFLLANFYPFISLKLSGRIEKNVLLSGAVALYRNGMGETGLLVFITSFLFPLLTILGMLYMLLPVRFGYRPWHLGTVHRVVRAMAPWSLLGVFLLGTLIAIVKLLDMATIIPGVSFYAFAALVVVSAAAQTQLDPRALWPNENRTQPAFHRGDGTARSLGLIPCHTCGLLVSDPVGGIPAHVRCPRCGTVLHRRKANSISRTWALLCAAAVLLIPANVYPVMTVIRFGQGEPNTILSGVVHLIEGGMWPLALIVFFASMVVPILKLIVLSFLLITLHRRSSWRPRDRTLLFRVTEVIGAWSMVDIFLLAVLVALVNLGALATIRPGIGATFFGAVVVTTMFAAHSFDPRLIWDYAAAPNPAPERRRDVPPPEQPST